jgi:phosphonate transport system permease protein
MLKIRWTNLLNRLSHPRELVLSNGKRVRVKRSMSWLILLLMIVLVIFTAMITRVNLSILMRRGHQFFVILQQMLAPNLRYIRFAWQPLIETMVMSLFGTLIGAASAVPFAYLSSGNVFQNYIQLMSVKFMFSSLRVLPVIVYALIFRFIFGSGALAGALALALFTFSIVTKMLYELIETVDMDPFEALISCGATRFRAFRAAIFPQIKGQYFSMILYSLEINVRNAAILGYVGAGGIGMLINQEISLRAYDNLGTIVFMLFILVSAVEFTSKKVRAYLN